MELLMVVRRSSMFKPYAASARGFTTTRTAGRCPPLMLTTPTPLSCEIFCAMRVSAKSSTSVSGITLDVMPKIRTGASAGLTLAYIGGAGRS